MLELTDRCNLKCMICNREEYEEIIGGPGTMMKLEDIARLEDPIRYAELLTITGLGETFLHPQLKTILDTIYRINPRDNLINIVTNGTALGADKAPWFAGHLNSLAVSLNAANPAAYAREMHPYEVAENRDMGGRFGRLVDKIIAFADRLSVADRRKVHLHFVVHRENMCDMADFVRLAHKIGLSQVNFTHFKVHRERNIGSSIYWAKEDYNDAFDEAVQIGLELGVGVGGRRFFTEEPKQFVAERDCTWPIDTSIIGAQGKVAPCCYWSGGGLPGNPFAGTETFDDIWFGDFYEKLRQKRDAPPCQTCNILRTFDDVVLHFSPFLKRLPSFHDELARYREIGAKDLRQQNNCFDRVGLDMAFHRSALRLVGAETSILMDVDVDQHDPLAAIDQALRECILARPELIKAESSINLTGQFLGTGWGASESNQHGQRWRWLGAHDGPATIFLRAKPEKACYFEIRLHQAIDEATLKSISATVNGFDVEQPKIFWRDEYAYYAAIIRDEAVADGLVQLALFYDNPARSPRQVSMAALSLEPLDYKVSVTRNVGRPPQKFRSAWRRVRGGLLAASRPSPTSI